MRTFKYLTIVTLLCLFTSANAGQTKAETAEFLERNFRVNISSNHCKVVGQKARYEGKMVAYEPFNLKYADTSKIVASTYDNAIIMESQTHSIKAKVTSGRDAGEVINAWKLIISNGSGKADLAKIDKAFTHLALLCGARRT